MRLTSFIKTHNDWEKLLSEPPYCVKIKRDGGYVIFSYNQLFSDFSDELVRECRGVILDENTFEPAGVPFYKFGNYGENYVPDIDWSSARVQEKIDGSLFKVWYHNGSWRVSTNGTIDAHKAELSRTDLFEDDCPYLTYGDLFEQAKKLAGLNYDKLDKDCVYMFELVSPYNKVVVLYDKLDIYHIGTRNNKTLQELDVDIGIKKPRQFAINSLQACIEQAKNLPSNKEGYVVVDKFYNRVKVKNPVYVSLHHLKNNGEPSIAGLVSIIRNNELGEFLTYFPEFKSSVCACKDKIDRLIADLDNNARELSKQTFATQKDFALQVKDRFLCRFYFEWYKTPALTATEWFWCLPDEKIVKILTIIGE